VVDFDGAAVGVCPRAGDEAMDPVLGEQDDAHVDCIVLCRTALRSISIRFRNPALSRTYYSGAPASYRVEPIGGPRPYVISAVTAIRGRGGHHGRGPIWSKPCRARSIRGRIENLREHHFEREFVKRKKSRAIRGSGTT